MFKRKHLCVALAAAFAGGMSYSAFAQDTQKVDRVEVTGSSIKKIEGESALPVTVIKREDIEKSGASNVDELVSRLTYNNGGGRALTESLGETSAPGQSGASIRGLGRDRTLVLLNGRRLAVYPFTGSGVDLNSIPLAAIERIEILRDGASAVYGSDAIGGVINFITRKDFKGAEVSASYEQPQAGGGKVTSVSASGGWGDLAKDRFNVMGSLSYDKYDVIKASQRSFSLTGNRPDLGIVKFSSNTFPANAFRTDTGARIQSVSNYPVCDQPNSFPYAGACRYDYSSQIDIYPASKRLGLFGRANFQLDADNLLFAEASHNRNEITYGVSQTPSVTTGKDNYYFPGVVGGVVPKYYPIAQIDAGAQAGYRGPIRIQWRMVDGGQRQDKVTTDTNRFLLGAEGILAGWDYKAGLMSVEVKARDNYINGYFSDTKLRTALATGNVNPFGPNDAAGLALLEGAAIRGDIRISSTKATLLDFKVSRELMQMAGGPLAVALGAELRTEKYSDGYTDISSSGDIVGGSGNQGPVSGKRNVTGLFAELNIPFLKTVEGQIALRMDRYGSATGTSADFNGVSTSAPGRTSTNPKFSLRWQPSKEFLVRGSIGTGFRMPTLDNLYQPTSGTNTGGQWTDPYYNFSGLPTSSAGRCAAVLPGTQTPNPDYHPDDNFCDAQLTTTNSGNTNLRPEKSKQYTLGLVFEPVRDLSISVDYFDIKITNGITALGGDDILNDWYKNATANTTNSSSVYANRLVTTTTQVAGQTVTVLDYVRGSLENVAEATVAGFDLSAKYRMKTSAGTFTPSWEGTYLTKSTSSNIVTNDVANNLGQYFRGGPVLRFKQLYQLDWNQGAWGATVRYQWQSGYRDYGDTRNVSTYEITDIQGQYTGIKNLTITAGIKNLFNRLPPTTVQEDYFQVGFDPTYADVKGRTWYVRANYKVW
jgi:iron complex outermembrane receptor protein